VPQRLYHEDPVKMLECQARRCLEAAGPDGFALSCGGVIDRGTPPENMDALIEATEECYGAIRRFLRGR
jgi:uroporphyrinogen-III decarboxylase